MKDSELINWKRKREDLLKLHETERKKWAEEKQELQKQINDLMYWKIECAKESVDNVTLKEKIRTLGGLGDIAYNVWEKDKETYKKSLIKKIEKMRDSQKSVCCSAFDWCINLIKKER